MASFDDYRTFTDRRGAGVELAFRLGRFKRQTSDGEIHELLRDAVSAASGPR